MPHRHGLHVDHVDHAAEAASQHRHGLHVDHVDHAAEEAWCVENPDVVLDRPGITARHSTHRFLRRNRLIRRERANLTANCLSGLVPLVHQLEVWVVREIWWA
jgi:hypothetical protein